MKKKINQFFKQNKTRFLSIALVLMLCVGLFFGGCTEEDESSFDMVSKQIAGFKATFKTQSDNSATEDQNDSYVYSVNNQLYKIIILYLQEIYGGGNLTAISEAGYTSVPYDWLYNNFETYDNGSLPVYYDSIRTYVYGTSSSVQDADIKWEWGTNNINSDYGVLQGLNITEVKRIYEDVGSPIEITNYAEYFEAVALLADEEAGLSIVNPIYSSYNTTYAIPIQLNMYEVLLGKQVTKFEIKIDNTTYETKVKIPGGSDALYEEAYLGISNVNKDIVEKHKALELEYYQKSSYSGFTKKDADNLISYILNNIIGEKAVEADIATTFYGGITSNSFDRITINAYKRTGAMYDIKDATSEKTVAPNKKASYRNYIGTVTHLVYSLLSNGSYEFAAPLNLKIGEKRYNVVVSDKYVTKDNPAEGVDNYKEIVITFKYPHPDPENYPDKDKIDENGMVTVDNGKFSATPATFARDFPGDTFFESGVEGQAYKDIPRAEYQSFIIMPKGNEIYFGTYWMTFLSYTRDLKMNVVGRFNVYDEETGDNYLFQAIVQTVDFANAEEEMDGETVGYYDDYEFCVPDFKKLLGKAEATEEFYVYKNGQTVEPSEYQNILTLLESKGHLKYDEDGDYYKVKLTNFNNSDEAISLHNGASAEDIMNALIQGTGLPSRIEAPFNKETGEAVKTTELVYKTISSSGNFGGISVLDENKVNFSYFELVFDIQKDPEAPPTKDYTFKPAIFLFD